MTGGAGFMSDPSPCAPSATLPPTANPCNGPFSAPGTGQALGAGQNRGEAPRGIVAGNHPGKGPLGATVPLHLSLLPSPSLTWKLMSDGLEAATTPSKEGEVI